MSSTDNSNYRSELFVPINRDERSFEELQRSRHQRSTNSSSSRSTSQVEQTFPSPSSSRSQSRVVDPYRPIATLHDDWYQDVVSRMEMRRRRWQDEMQQMREEFFQLKPRPAQTPLRSTDFSEPLCSMMDSSWNIMDSPNFFRRPLWNGAGDFHERQHSNESMSSMWPSTRSYDVPVKNMGTPDTLYELDEDGRMHFSVRFDVSDYNMEDITVATKDQRLTVTARKEINTINAASTKEFSRTLDIPKNVNPEKLTCTLTANGILILSSPVDCPSYQIAAASSASSTLSKGSPGFGSQPRNYVDDACSTTSSTYTPSLFNEDVSIKSNVSQHRSLGPVIIQSPSSEASISNFSASKSGDINSIATEASLSSSSMSPSLSTMGNDGIIQLPDNRREFQVRVDMGDEYLPNEIFVKTHENKVFVHARHEERGPSRTTFREFSKEFDVPPNVDPQTVTAKFRRGVLFLCAPVVEDNA